MSKVPNLRTVFMLITKAHHKFKMHFQLVLPSWHLTLFLMLLCLPLLRAEVSVAAVGAQLLVIPLHHSNFSISHPDVHFTASIAELPDLPSWLYLSQSPSSGTAFLYGVPPPQQSQLMIEVIARSQLTFDTTRQLFDVSISPNKRWQYGVSLKITNMNLPDLLSDDGHEVLLQVVASDLWTGSPQVYHSLDHAVVAAPSKRSVPDPDAASWISLHDLWSPLSYLSPAKDARRLRRADAAASEGLVRRNLVRHPQPDAVVITGLLPATSVGDRVPLQPHIKEGVYASFGSNAPFSESLLHLQREVSILLNRSPCPHYFKKTSYERFFRARGFAVDWCSFRLSEGNASEWGWRGTEEPSPRRQQDALPDVASDLLSQHPSLLPLMHRQQVPHHSYTAAVVETVLVPVLVMLLLVTLLTLAMCCAPLHQGETATAFMDELIDGFPRKATFVELAKGGTPQHRQQQLQQQEPVEHPSLRSRRSQQSCREASVGAAGGDADNGYDTAPDISSDPGAESSCSSGDSIQLAHSTPRRFEDYATLTRPAPPPYSRAGSTGRFDD